MRLWPPIQLKPKAHLHRRTAIFPDYGLGRVVFELVEGVTPGAEATTAAMVNPKIANLFQTVGQDLAKSGGKGLPYEALKDIRSKIGAELSDFSLAPDKPTAQYKALAATVDVQIRTIPATAQYKALAGTVTVRSTST